MGILDRPRKKEGIPAATRSGDRNVTPYNADRMYAVRFGEVTERPKVRHWKCRVGVKPHRGFESRPLRLFERVYDVFWGPDCNPRNGDCYDHQARRSDPACPLCRRYASTLARR